VIWQRITNIAYKLVWDNSETTITYFLFQILFLFDIRPSNLSHGLKPMLSFHYVEDIIKLVDVDELPLPVPAYLLNA